MIESELKIPVQALPPVRERLTALGARQLSTAELEINMLFDTPAGDLRKSSEVLRVRRVGDRARLTFKGPASWAGAVKQRREIEVEITSAETMSALLEALGYQPWIRYEKIRESWVFGAVRIELDHTPIGDFVEIEGPPDDLAEAAASVGLNADDAVAGSYISLWLDHRSRHDGLGTDMVFDS